MADPSEDLGVIQALLERFQKQRLPRLLQLKKSVDSGERLSNIDLSLLEEVAETARKIEPLVNRHPEYRELYARAIHLHKEITDRALENEKRR